MIAGAWRIGVDVGGTFADCVAVAPDGSRRRIKLLTDGRLRTRVDPAPTAMRLPGVPAWAVPALPGMRWTSAAGTSGTVSDAVAVDGGCEVSAPGAEGAWLDLSTGEEAPVLGARLLTGTAPGRPFPPIELRIGTTRGTNALLEGTCDAVAAFVNEGLEGLLAIGTQARTGLFDLVPRHPPSVARAALGVPARRAHDGSVVVPLDQERIRLAARSARSAGFRHAAVALLHSPAAPGDEASVAGLLQEEGFERVVRSSEVSAEPELLVRARTACVDASLTTAVHGLLARIASDMPTARLLVAGSAGGVVDAGAFLPKDSLLSGPAMGCATARMALEELGIRRAITFDMGGTSTDVARVDEGGVSMRDRSTVAGISVSVPCVDVHSVAAGGGSICRGSAEGLFVGPGSAGANPGPACYGRGGPLTVTDVNLLLGRLPGSIALLPLDHDAALAAAVHEAERAGRPLREALEGFLALANEHMAGAVRAVTALHGRDPRDYALAVFGGAGGQHGCAVAEALGMRELVVLPHAGFVSGEGALSAPVQRIATVRVESEVGDGSALRAACSQAGGQARQALAAEEGEARVVRMTASMRSAGQAGTLDVELDPAAPPCPDDVRARFRHGFAAMFGRNPRAGEPVVESIRAIAEMPRLAVARDAPRRAVVFPSGARQPLQDGEPVHGPALVLEDGATTCVDAGWVASGDPSGALRVRRIDAPRDGAGLSPEVVAARLSSIAAWMSAVLERTARSVNIRDRLDCSCGILSADGILCANAPNVPVHLGALGACVRSVAEACPIAPGETVLTNHPAFGGSHLPDLTLVRAVHDGSGKRIACVAVRAHHAEIGGIRPGSMPPDARTLEEEGVAMAPFVVARDGALDESGLRHRLGAARWPTRDADLNVDDVRAALAALDVGEAAIRSLAGSIGADRLRTAIDSLLARSAARTRAVAAALPAAGIAFADLMDDGTPVVVRIDRRGDGLLVDFTGSGCVHLANLNAPVAVVRSAVLYCLRVAAGLLEPLDEHRAPLNEGFLVPVDLLIPPGILNPPFGADPGRCPPVFAGNTETSQRVVDAILGALGIAAGSQGTMNNLVIAGNGFSSFETLGGGTGAAAGLPGADAVHSHMTNTRITDPETMERRMPLRVERLQLRPGSGGIGAFPGGMGMVRRIRVLAGCEACFVGERRRTSPAGCSGGGPGRAGAQRVIRADGTSEELPGTFAIRLGAGDAIEVETPGGGGFGPPERVSLR